jgi:hypothetical protein
MCQDQRHIPRTVSRIDAGILGKIMFDNVGISLGLENEEDVIIGLSKKIQFYTL